MPKSGKKSEKKSNRDIASDIKLSDFADCSARTGRLRKSAGSSLHEEVQDIRNPEIPWFERDVDEFEFSPASTENRKKNKNKIIIPQNLQDRPGNQYPIDIWFLIGRYIKPEDVKTFAAICKGSYNVSRTYSFWMKMYKRHYKPDANLPQRLQPECIEGSLCCLKVYVIRALYHMYPHFTTQLSHKTSADVHSLSNLCCTSTWRVQQNGKWLFHFKFQAPKKSAAAPVSYRSVIQDMWTKQEEDEKSEVYVNHNPDEGCKILRISCSQYVVVSPFIMGSRLSDVRINLAHDMRRQKLKLIFCYSNYRQANKSASSSKENGVYGHVVEFDPVENFSIFNWWHPQYPSGCKV